MNVGGYVGGYAGGYAGGYVGGYVGVRGWVRVRVPSPRPRLGMPVSQTAARRQRRTHRPSSRPSRPVRLQQSRGTAALVPAGPNNEGLLHLSLSPRAERFTNEFRSLLHCGRAHTQMGAPLVVVVAAAEAARCGAVRRGAAGPAAQVAVC